MIYKLVVAIVLIIAARKIRAVERGSGFNRPCFRSSSVRSARHARSADPKRTDKKELERKRKAKEREARRIEKEAEKADKLKLQKEIASSDLEYLSHRLNQIYKLIELAEEDQEGTIYGGKEWVKHEKRIMQLEAQAQSLKKKERQARAIRNK